MKDAAGENLDEDARENEDEDTHNAAKQEKKPKVVRKRVTWRDAALFLGSLIPLSYIYSMVRIDRSATTPGEEARRSSH